MIGWIDQHRDAGGLGHQIMEKSQPLGRNLSGEKIDPGRVAARLGKAGDQTKPDGVVADAEDDRDACGRSLGRLSNGGLTGRSDNGYATADEVSHERRQAIVSALQPVVFDHDVLALDVAGFVEAVVERSRIAPRGLRRPNVDEADDRHRWLLRARRERPCCRAAHERDERAAPHVWMAPAWQEIIWRAAQRSLAVMCPACWCSPGGLLALMGSANRVLIIRTGSMSQ